MSYAHKWSLSKPCKILLGYSTGDLKQSVGQAAGLPLGGFRGYLEIL